MHTLTTRRACPAIAATHAIAVSSAMIAVVFPPGSRTVPTGARPWSGSSAVTSPSPVAEVTGWAPGATRVTS
ncbi:hypothetical protein MBRU_04960 [Mycolicibacterium brumae DSM 44177]|nr:hypothetical protein MBRU_04960 [Mycolicibacterium brumae DSM 44177]